MRGARKGGPETQPLLEADHDPSQDNNGGKQRSSMPPYSTWGAFTVFLFPALGGLLFGYDIGATSGVLEQLKSANVAGVSWQRTVSESSVLQGTITSGVVFGAVVGSLICFRVERRLGRRREIILAAALYALGAAVEWLSGVTSFSAGLGISLLLLGRLMYGIGVGFAMHGAPAYIGEMSPPSIRGLLVGMKEAFIVVGILIGYVVGYLLEDTMGGWRTSYGIAVGPALIQLVGMYFMPPSARWLVLTGRSDKAGKSLAYVTPHVPDHALEDIQITVDKLSDGDNVQLSALWRPTCKPAMIAGVGLVLLQQITGQPSVLYYADSIFADVGLSSLSSILIGAFKLLATLTAVFTADKRGRKTLLSVGCWMMLIALVALGITFFFDYVSSEECNQYTDATSCANFNSKCEFASDCVCDDTDSGSDACTCCSVGGLDAQKIVILIAMFVYIGGYQVGFGPIVWLLISELFPLELRGKAISVAVVANFTSNLLVTFLFPVEMDLIGTSWTFLIFAVIDLYALWFIYTRVPETKGLTLEQIEHLFQRIADGESMRGK